MRQIRPGTLTLLRKLQTMLRLAAIAVQFLFALPFVVQADEGFSYRSDEARIIVSGQLRILPMAVVTDSIRWAELWHVQGDTLFFQECPLVYPFPKRADIEHQDQYGRKDATEPLRIRLASLADSVHTLAIRPDSAAALYARLASKSPAVSRCPVYRTVVFVVDASGHVLHLDDFGRQPPSGVLSLAGSFDACRRSVHHALLKGYWVAMRPGVWVDLPSRPRPFLVRLLLGEPADVPSDVTDRERFVIQDLLPHRGN